MSFLEELTKEGVIERSQIGALRSRAEEKYGGDIDAALLESGVMEDKILEAKGKYLQIPIKKVDKDKSSFKDRKSVV